MNINVVHVCGRITQDLVVKNPNPNLTVLAFSVASNRSWKDKAGNKQQETEFHNMVSFGNQANTIAQWFAKGDEIYIQGRLKTQSWEDKSGVKKYRTEIIVEKFEFGQKAVKKETATPTTTDGPDYSQGGGSTGGGQEMIQSKDVDINDIPF